MATDVALYVRSFPKLVEAFTVGAPAQHEIESSLRTAQALLVPSATEVAYLPGPKLTAVKFSPMSPGFKPTFAVNPVPNLPYSPEPKHFRLVSTRITHVMLSAVNTLSTGPPTSITGKLLPIWDVEVPHLGTSTIPSWPREFSPKQWRLPFISTTHVCAAPHETCLTNDPSGSPEFTVASPFTPFTLAAFPIPNWPLELYPQHLSWRVSSTTHVWAFPVDTSRTVRFTPTFANGRLSPICSALAPIAPVVYEIPVCRYWFCPQHFSFPSVDSAHIQYEYIVMKSTIPSIPVPRLTYGRLSPISPGSSPNIVSWKSTPSTPFELRPQHLTLLTFSMMAHVAAKPVAICLTTAVGAGPKVGRLVVGDAVGEFVGEKVGGVGELVGMLVGALEGEFVGGVGDSVGDKVGGVGALEGEFVGGVGDAVGDKVGGVGDSVGDKVGGVGALEGEFVGGVGDSVGDKVGGVGDSVGDNVGGVGDAVGDKVGGVGGGGGPVSSGVGTWVGDKVGEKVGEKDGGVDRTGDTDAHRTTIKNKYKSDIF